MRNSLLLIVVVSGAVCSGKSALARQLAERHGAKVVKTRELITEARPKTHRTRKALQRAGDALDREDGGKWVSNALARSVDRLSKGKTPSGLFVVDSVRIPGQVEAIRSAFGADVHHIHVTAEPEELRRRYEQRRLESDDQVSFDEIQKNRTERNIERLAGIADIVVATDRCSKEAVFVRATALLNLYPRRNTRLVDVIVGGQYGSEGKGNIVGHLASEYELLVRVGGPNAGHTVYAAPEPEKYYHLPSGTRRAPNAHLLLGAGAVIYPPTLLKEIARHQIEVERLSIDPQAMVIEEADQEAEAEGLASISSTGQGVGSASARKITDRGRYADGGSMRLAKDVPELKPYIREGQSVLEKHFADGKRIMLEGTQGTLLSMHHGQYPYVTSRDTTVAGCLADAGIAPTNVQKVIMVCRTYPIRVGGPSGPLGIEISYEKLAERSGISIDELLRTEKTTTTNKQRRLAEFDWFQFKRAVQLNGPTDIALTFADYLSIENRGAFRVEQLTEETRRFVEEMERVSGRPVSMISTAFNWRNVIDRRNW